MTEIERFVTPPFSANAWLVIDSETKNCVLIDVGGGFCEIQTYAEEHGLKIIACLFTHGHFDHIGEAKLCSDSGIPLYISVRDAHMLAHNNNLAKYAGYNYVKTKADYTFSDGDVLTFGNLVFKVIATPGHTAGSVSFLLDNVCFTGDTLFFESVGRTDFPTGCERDMEQSLNKLFELNGDVRVLPGHSKETTIAHEKEYRSNLYA